MNLFNNLKFAAVLGMAAVFTLAGCSSNPAEGIVKDHLAKAAGVDAKSVKIVDISEPLAWHGSDSLEILKKKLESELANKIVHLKAAIDASNKAIESAQEVQKSGFKSLIGIANETIAQSEEQVEMATALLAAYESDCAGTPLENLYNRVQDFETRKEEILYQVIHGKYSTKQDKEVREFHLMADKELKTVTGSLPEQTPA